MNPKKCSIVPVIVNNIEMTMINDNETAELHMYERMRSCTDACYQVIMNNYVLKQINKFACFRNRTMYLFLKILKLFTPTLLARIGEYLLQPDLHSFNEGSFPSLRSSFTNDSEFASGDFQIIDNIFFRVIFVSSFFK